MLEYREKTVQEVAAGTCDRCHLHMTPNDHDWHEKISISFVGGFDSIFGDGTAVSIDLCQECVKETLGTWLRITPSNSIDWFAPTDTGNLSSTSDHAFSPLRDAAYRYDHPNDSSLPVDDAVVDSAAAENPDLPRTFVAGTLQGLVEAQAGQLTPFVPSNHWNHRIIESTNNFGESWRAMHEVHYTNGVPTLYTQNPIAMTWDVADGEAAPFVLLARMRKALTQPVLGESDFHPCHSSSDIPNEAMEFASELQRLLDTTPIRRATLTMTPMGERTVRMAQTRMRKRSVRMVLNGTIWRTAKEVGEHADPDGTDKHALADHLLKTRQVFALERAGVSEFPDYQFDALGKPVPAMREILTILDGFSPFAIASWFESTSSMLGGQRPREILDERPDQVIAAAKAYVEGPQHG